MNETHPKHDGDPVYECMICGAEELLEDADDSKWTNITFTPCHDANKHWHLELCEKCMAHVNNFIDATRLTFQYAGLQQEDL